MSGWNGVFTDRRRCAGLLDAYLGNSVTLSFEGGHLRDLEIWSASFHFPCIFLSASMHVYRETAALQLAERPTETLIVNLGFNLRKRDEEHVSLFPRA